MKDFFQKILIFPLRLFFKRKIYSSKNSGNPKNILIIWSSQNIGELLSGRILLQSLKNSISDSKITLLVDRHHVAILSKNEIFSTFGLTGQDHIMGSQQMMTILKTKYDATVVLTIEKFRFTDHLLAWLSGAGIKIGISSVNEIKNNYDFIYDKTVDINFSNYSDSHFTEDLFKLIEPFVATLPFSYSNISFYKSSEKIKSGMMLDHQIPAGNKLIGLFFDSNKISDKWSSDKILKVFKGIEKRPNCSIYFITSGYDPEIHSG